MAFGMVVSKCCMYFGTCPGCVPTSHQVTTGKDPSSPVIPIGNQQKKLFHRKVEKSCEQCTLLIHRINAGDFFFIFQSYRCAPQSSGEL